jgi:hypothetical protein
MASGHGPLSDFLSRFFVQDIQGGLMLIGFGKCDRHHPSANCFFESKHG